MCSWLATAVAAKAPPGAGGVSIPHDGTGPPVHQLARPPGLSSLALFGGAQREGLGMSGVVPVRRGRTHHGRAGRPDLIPMAGRSNPARVPVRRWRIRVVGAIRRMVGSRCSPRRGKPDPSRRLASRWQRKTLEALVDRRGLTTPDAPPLVDLPPPVDAPAVVLGPCDVLVVILPARAVTREEADGYRRQLSKYIESHRIVIVGGGAQVAVLQGAAAPKVST